MQKLMKMKYNLLFFGLLLVTSIVVLSSYTNVSQDPWSIPAEYEEMVNPVEADSESLKIGKRLYNKHCKSCHGKEGLGDGSKAAQLDTPCGDLSSEEYKSQSDGAKFYKSKIGRDEMPNYEKKIRDDEDIWHIINYMDQF